MADDEIWLDNDSDEGENADASSLESYGLGGGLMADDVALRGPVDDNDDDDSSDLTETPQPPAKRARYGAHTERKLRRWPLRSNTDVTGMSAESEAVRQRFSDKCKHWCFQLEKGKKTGRLHYQCRIVMEPPVRCHQVIRMFPGYHVGIESTNGGDTGLGALYVMKPDTREDGPWSDRDVEIYKDPRYLLPDLRPWQAEFLRRLDTQDARQMLIVVDPAGNSGKTVMAHHVVQHRGGVFVPPFCQTGDDIMQFCCSLMESGKQYTILIDIPRASLVPRLAPRLFAAFETLKSGYLYDKRYHGKFKYIKPPLIACFCNTKPDASLLTGDRWDVLNLPWVAPPVQASAQ